MASSKICTTRVSFSPVNAGVKGEQEALELVSDKVGGDYGPEEAQAVLEAALSFAKTDGIPVNVFVPKVKGDVAYDFITPKGKRYPRKAFSHKALEKVMKGREPQLLVHWAPGFPCPYLALFSKKEAAEKEAGTKKAVNVSKSKFARK